MTGLKPWRHKTLQFLLKWWNIKLQRRNKDSGILGSHALSYSAFLESRFQAIPDASDSASA
ncbi:hypothetical protein IGI04_036336 [Brassica rapa subsp. trilocularis]|uniref:Uncharacterized protein n=1 Tax=Brassica rapa subsp. trilocularis TaxID=1813537 RepID=A0ABQ7LGH0_BRACM|nr:hypothetical protein IGI04_036336 [Brassica rapa subsp. trilocularis]